MIENNEIVPLLLEQMAQWKQKPLGIERENLLKINEIHTAPQALVISGLRRAGKSTLLAQICSRVYKDTDYYAIHFEDERWASFRVEQFNTLYETLVELFGERRVFFIDEVQNIEGWERFVRHFMDRGFKFYLTGSNAALLSQELGTKLTGRYVPMELFPFSFRERLRFEGLEAFAKDPHKPLKTEERGTIKRIFNDYLAAGGIPDALKYRELNLLPTLYRDILYRDVATRYRVSDLKALRELALFLMSHSASLISFNKIKQQLMLGSVNTVKNYVDYLEMSWLIFTVNCYSPSVKRQQIAAKKVYVIDPGLIRAVAFKTSEDRGRLLETVVFLELRRRWGDSIYYYKSDSEFEVDFYITGSEPMLIQVCCDLTKMETRKREVRALLSAAKSLKLNEALILTEDGREAFTIEGVHIKVIPVYEWLLAA